MRREGEAGFSLIEVLVVLAMLATMAGVTILSFGAGERGDQLEAEATLLANRLALASDEALMSGGDLSLGLSAAGYGIDVWSGQSRSWVPHPSKVLGVRHELPGGISMDVEPSVGRIALRPDATGESATIVFSDSSGAWRVVHDGLSARAAPLER